MHHQFFLLLSFLQALVIPLVNTVPLSKGSLLHPDFLQSGSIPYLPGVVTGVLLVCFVIVLAGCLCCPHQRLKNLGQSNGIALSQKIYHNLPRSSFELDSIHHQLSRQFYEDEVEFDQPPEIHFRKQSDLPADRVPHPAYFGQVPSKQFVLEEWLDNSFNRHHIQYLNEIGNGWFGKVVEGQVQEIGVDQPQSRVAIKILNEDALPSQHNYFLNEVEVFRKLRHPNILRVIGQCLEDSPFLILLEFVSMDLKKFLINDQSKRELLVESESLLRMAVNVASGLQHIHEQGFIHTDLAARNCVITSDWTVKIGDYGTSVEKYKGDYYCLGDMAISVRWCSPDSLLCTKTSIETRELTKQANIWSFGVVLWEIFQFGDQPYSELRDDDVIQKVIMDKNVVLQQPKIPLAHVDKVYQIMKLCWVTDSEKPGLDTLEALLTHLYKNKGATPSNSDDLERRWQALYPVSRDHGFPFTKNAKCSLKFENDFVPEVSVEDHTLKRDGLLFSLNSEQLPNETSSLKSFTMDCDDKLHENISPSLQNLRSSIEELSERDTKVEQILSLQNCVDDEGSDSLFLDVGEGSSSTELTYLIASNEQKEMHNGNVTMVEETLLPFCRVNETDVASTDWIQNVAVFQGSISMETQEHEIENAKDLNDHDEPDNGLTKTFPHDMSEKSDFYFSQVTNTTEQSNSGTDNILYFPYDLEKEFCECTKSSTEILVDGSSLNISPASHTFTGNVTPSTKSSNTELCQTEVGYPTTDMNQFDSSHTSSEVRSQPHMIGDKSLRILFETTLPNFSGKNLVEAIVSGEINNDLSVLEVNSSSGDSKVHVVEEVSSNGCTLFESSVRGRCVTESDCSTGWESNKKEPCADTQSSKVRHDSTASTRKESSGDDSYVKYYSTLHFHSLEEKPTSILHLCLDKETGERGSCLENPGIPFSDSDCCYSDSFKLLPAVKAKDIVSFDGSSEAGKEQIGTSVCKFGDVVSCGEKEMMLGPSYEMRTKVGHKSEQTCVTVDDIRLSFPPFDSENISQINSSILSFPEHYKVKNLGVCSDEELGDGGHLSLSCETLKFSDKEITSPALDSGENIVNSSDKQQIETHKNSDSNHWMSDINIVSSGCILVEHNSEQDSVYRTVKENNIVKSQDEHEDLIMFEMKLGSPTPSTESYLLTSETCKDLYSNKPFTTVGAVFDGNLEIKNGYNGLSDNENLEQSFSNEKDQISSDQELEELIYNNIVEQNNQLTVSSSFRFQQGEPDSKVTEKGSVNCEPLFKNMEKSGFSQEVHIQEDVSMFQWSNEDVISSSFDFYSTQYDEHYTTIGGGDHVMEGNKQTMGNTTIIGGDHVMEVNGSFEDNIQISVNNILDNEVSKLTCTGSSFNQSYQEMSEFYSAESSNQDTSNEDGQYEMLQKEVSCIDTMDNIHDVSIEKSNILPFQCHTEAEGPDSEVLGDSFTEKASLQDRKFQHQNRKYHVSDEPPSGSNKFSPLADSSVIIVLDQLLLSEVIQVVQTNICKGREEENTSNENLYYSDTMICQNEFDELSRRLEVVKENAPIPVVKNEMDMLPVVENAGEHVKNHGSTGVIPLDKSVEDFSSDETYLKDFLTDQRLKHSDNEFRDAPADDIFIATDQQREGFFDEVINTDEGQKEQTASTSSSESVGEYQLEDILEGLSEGETKTSLSHSHHVSENIGYEGEEICSNPNYFEFPRPFQEDSNVCGSKSIVDQGGNDEVFRLLRYDHTSFWSKEQELSILCSEQDDVCSRTEPTKNHSSSIDGLSIYRSPEEAFIEKPMNVNGQKVIQDVSNQLFCYNEEPRSPNMYYNSYPLVLESPKGELIFEGDDILSGRECLCTDQSGDVEVTSKDQEGLLILSDDDIPEQESLTENTGIERGLNVICRKDFGKHNVDFHLSDTDDSSSSDTTCSPTSGPYECFNLKFRYWKVEKDFKGKNPESDELEEEKGDVKFSTWDCNATPTRSALLSTERKLLGMKKSVSFHEDYPVLIYNYPPEIESNDDVEDDAEAFVWSMYDENYADWDLEGALGEDHPVAEDIKQNCSAPICFEPLVSTHQNIDVSYTVGSVSDNDDVVEDVPKIAAEEFVQDIVQDNKNLLRKDRPCFKESLSYSDSKNKEVLSHSFFTSCKPGTQYPNKEDKNQFCRSGADTSGSVALSYMENESSSSQKDETQVVTEAYNLAIMTVHDLEVDNCHPSYDHMTGCVRNSMCEESQSGVSYDFQPLSNLLTLPDKLPNFVDFHNLGHLKRDVKGFYHANTFKPLTSNEACFEWCTLRQSKEPIQNTKKEFCVMEENFGECTEIGVERLKKEPDPYSPNNELSTSDFHFEIADSDQEDFFKCDVQELDENCKECESSLDEIIQSFTEGNIAINYKESENSTKLMMDRDIQSQQDDLEDVAESLTERNGQRQCKEPEDVESLTERDSQSERKEPEDVESLTERDSQSERKEPEDVESLTERDSQSERKEPKDVESLTERDSQSECKEPEDVESLTVRDSQSERKEPEDVESLTERNSQSERKEPEDVESLTERDSQSERKEPEDVESLTERDSQSERKEPEDVESLTERDSQSERKEPEDVESLTERDSQSERKEPEDVESLTERNSQSERKEPEDVESLTERDSQSERKEPEDVESLTERDSQSECKEPEDVESLTERDSQSERKEPEDVESLTVRDSQSERKEPEDVESLTVRDSQIERKEPEDVESLTERNSQSERKEPEDVESLTVRDSQSERKEPEDVESLTERDSQSERKEPEDVESLTERDSQSERKEPEDVESLTERNSQSERKEPEDVESLTERDSQSERKEPEDVESLTVRDSQSERKEPEDVESLTVRDSQSERKEPEDVESLTVRDSQSERKEPEDVESLTERDSQSERKEPEDVESLTERDSQSERKEPEDVESLTERNSQSERKEPEDVESLTERDSQSERKEPKDVESLTERNSQSQRKEAEKVESLIERNGQNQQDDSNPSSEFLTDRNV
ncbi:uncharacterized protein LOC143244455 [Tachypleus tridentatus]|uniref:uncharacterized protein LOC143244455 n=1 Tax=Tachypleus tridentatus TaxID=6853 RepID=UPI003FD0A09C